MKAISCVALIALSLSVYAQTPAINNVSAKPQPFWIDVYKNENGTCLVRELSGAKRTLTTYIKDAPKTFYQDRKDFSREDAYVRLQTERLRQWKKRVDFLDGQASTGAAGDPAYVAAVMDYRRRVNAEMAQQESASSDLDAFKERLAEAKIKEMESPMVHHVIRCRVEFVKIREDGMPEWKFVK